MNKKRRPCFLALFQGNIADWIHSPRTVISLIAIFLFAYMNARSFSATLENYYVNIHAGECMLFYIASGFGNILLVSALFLVMMSEIPKRIPFQNLMLIRSNRRRWLTSQFVFCAMISVTMIISLLLFSVILTIQHISAGYGWSTLSNLSIDDWKESAFSIYKCFNGHAVGTACALSAAILFLFWYTMASVVLFFSLHGHQSLGVIVYVTILGLSIIVMVEYLPSWMRYTPVTFSTASAIIASFSSNQIEKMYMAISAYLLIDIAIYVSCLSSAKRNDLFYN